MGVACDIDNSYKLLPPPPLLEKTSHEIWHLNGQVVSEKIFENNGHIHVYNPGVRADNPLGPNIFHSHNNSVAYPQHMILWRNTENYQVLSR